MKNIECKLRVDGFEDVYGRLASCGAKKRGTLQQVDTYFIVRSGRLKLREIDTRTCELVYYERPDVGASKLSVYEIVPLDCDLAHKISSMLAASMGRRVVVKKERELWFCEYTRIHLDKVEGLGTYIELETVVGERTEDEARSEHSRMLQALELQQREQCALSYSDMLEAQAGA